jgi:protein-S-isoprenylcysteine O-methyltransferase Ste14
MTYIAIGALGFTAIHLCDLAALKKVPRVKPIGWGVGSGLLICALILISLSPDKLTLPTWLTWLGWGTLGVSAPLLIHSLFISLPFRKTYVTTGVGDKLVTSGLYALIRHPGVIWFTILMLSLIPVTKSSLFLVAAPVFIALDFVLVVVQDKFIFGRMFDGYDRYRQETPMLIPNKKSMSAFLRSIRQTHLNNDLKEVDQYE